MNRARGQGAEREVLDAMAFESGPIFRPSNPGRRLNHLRSGLIDQSQKMAASAMADMKVCAQRSQRGGGLRHFKTRTSARWDAICQAYCSAPWGHALGLVLRSGGPKVPFNPLIEDRL
jgi:hypothetical protein